MLFGCVSNGPNHECKRNQGNCWSAIRVFCVYRVCKLSWLAPTLLVMLHVLLQVLLLPRLAVYVLQQRTLARRIILRH
jgi:hypothetical protein